MRWCRWAVLQFLLICILLALWQFPSCMILPNYILQRSTNILLSTFNYSLQWRESWNTHFLPENPPSNWVTVGGRWCGGVGPQSQSESLKEKPGFGPISFQANFLTTQEHKSQNHIGPDGITQLYCSRDSLDLF